MLLKLAVAGIAGYALYKYATREHGEQQKAAFATGEATHGPAQVRNAGPEAMRDNPPGWDKTDQDSDESFPASDPPSTY
jgi:hypothetical protein